MKINLLAVAAVAVVGVAGCTFPSRSAMVNREQIGKVQRIEYGTVENVISVMIEGERGQIGLLGGGLTGAAAGGVGQGVGHDLARAGGAVAGAVAGQAVEEAVTRKPALEMTIKLESGALVVVTQATPPAFKVGDRVAIANGGSGSRVMLP